MGIEIKSINNTSPAVKEAIRRKSAASLPANPSDRGWGASEIIKTLYKPILDISNSAIAEINRVVDEINLSIQNANEAVIELENADNNILQKMDTVTIQSITFTGTDDAGGNVYEIAYNDKLSSFTAPKGDKGDRGDDLHIFKTFPSVDAMNAAVNEVPLNKFVLIATEDPEDAENSRMYIRSEYGFYFVQKLQKDDSDSGVTITKIFEGSVGVGSGGNLGPDVINAIYVIADFYDDNSGIWQSFLVKNDGTEQSLIFTNNPWGAELCVISCSCNGGYLDQADRYFSTHYKTDTNSSDIYLRSIYAIG